MNKCNWCSTPTENPTERVLNWRDEWILVAFCDKCHKATEEIGEYLLNPDPRRKVDDMQEVEFANIVNGLALNYTAKKNL